MEQQSRVYYFGVALPLVEKKGICVQKKVLFPSNVVRIKRVRAFLDRGSFRNYRELMAMKAILEGQIANILAQLIQAQADEQDTEKIEEALLAKRNQLSQILALIEGLKSEVAYVSGKFNSEPSFFHTSAQSLPIDNMNLPYSDAKKMWIDVNYPLNGNKNATIISEGTGNYSADNQFVRVVFELELKNESDNTVHRFDDVPTGNKIV